MFADLLAARPAVVLAPMAGVTNRAFRRVCREASSGPTIYVAEMTTSQALLMRHPETLDLITFDADESPRSIQLYGVDPGIVGAAVRMVVAEDRADHIDLNFGCPVPKVTRIGIDEDHITYLDAGRIAADAGVAWVALHGRTAAQYYGGTADWDAIARLVEHIPGTPVLGNGDIWSGQDAVDMLARTGAAGVVVGRGCLGRPWLFGQIDDALAGRPVRPEPGAEVILDLMRRHCALLVDMHGDEFLGCREMRKHMAWYLKGLVVGSDTRRELGLISRLEDLESLLATIETNQVLPPEVATAPRGRTTPHRSVALPDGWLSSPDLTPAQQAAVHEAELSVSGG